MEGNSDGFSFLFFKCKQEPGFMPLTPIPVVPEKQSLSV